MSKTNAGKHAALALAVLAAAAAATMLFRAREAAPESVQAAGQALKTSPASAAEFASRQLAETNSERMVGLADRANERWIDIAGNAYSTRFARGFSYTGDGKFRPEVRVRYERRAPTFRGRIEARGLKPNFAYQLKLRGDFKRDRQAFERIGYAGRWRLPGRDTNYSDYDYRWYEGDRSQIESYILFDFFVTDARGNATKLFALDSTLHVLFSASYQGFGTAWDGPLRRFTVDASNPDFYMLPKSAVSTHVIWAQAEYSEGRLPVGQVRLPPGRYAADLVLTEESFHSYGDGGFWATVMRLPVEFMIEESAGTLAGTPSPGSMP